MRFCGWFFLGTAVLFALIGLRYLAVAPAWSGGLGYTFTVLMFVSHCATAGALATVVVVPFALLVPRPRLVVVLGVFVAQLLSTLALLDTFVYQQYRFHLDASVWNLVTGGAGEETFVFATRTYVKFAALCLVLLLALVALARFAWHWTELCTGRRRGPWVAGALTCVIVAHQGVYAWADAAGYVPILRQSRLLPLHRPLTAKRAMRSLGVEVARAERAPNDLDSELNYPRAPLACVAKPKRLNVMFLVLDSWRADALNERAAPNLTALAADSVRFDDHYSGGNATRVGMFSLFYGLPGTYWHEMLGERRGPVLVQELQKAGYEVAAFSSAPLFSPEFDGTIFSDVQGLRLTSEGDTPAARDRDLSEDCIAWLGARDASRPFFALLFYDAPHAYDFPSDWPLAFQPSLPVVDYMTLDTDTDPEPFRNRYLNSVRFADHLAGRVLDGLRAHGLMDDTVVVVTGDHGQEFNDLKQNYWGHNSNFASFQTRVPMFVHWPGRASHTFTHRTSHFDVAPTILEEVLGCSNVAADYSVGRSLFDTGDRGVLTLSSYGESAGVAPNGRTLVVSQSGEIDVFDADYRASSMTDADREVLQAMFRQRNWFRAGTVKQE